MRVQQHGGPGERQTSSHCVSEEVVILHLLVLLHLMCEISGNFFIVGKAVPHYLLTGRTRSKRLVVQCGHRRLHLF